MKHLKKTWKVIAYIAVLFVLVILDLELIGQFYIAAGFVWLVVHILRNRDPDYRADTGINAPLLDSRNPNDSFYKY